MSGGAHGGDGAPRRASTPGAVPRNLTPVSNTGVISAKPPIPTFSESEALFRKLLRSGRELVVSMHWLTATSKVLDTTDCVAFISDYLGHGPEYGPTGQFGYTHAFTWFGGLKLLDNASRSEMGVCLLADGDTCEHFGFDKLSYIYQALQFTATRLDLAADGCRFTPKSLYKLWIADRVRSAVRSSRNALPGRARVRSHKWYTSPTGDTFYMGSRASTQFARVYNKRGFNRFELELKKERAAQVMQALCNGSSMSGALGASIAQFVTFVDASSPDPSRCKPLPFWRRFMDTLTSTGVVTRLTGRPEVTSERLIDWIETQVAPSLMVYEVLKGCRDSYDDVRRNLRKLGLERAKPRHRAMISTAAAWLRQHDEPQYLKVKGEPLSLLEQNMRYCKLSQAKPPKPYLL